MSIVIGGGQLIQGLSAKNVELIYPEAKSPTESFTRTQMLDFNDVKYEVKGDIIVLNKKDLFQNREVLLIQEQTCLTWTEPICSIWEERKPINCLKRENPEDEKSACIEWEDYKAVGCMEFDSKLGECLKWEKELECLDFNEITCKTWTTFTKNDFIKQAIQKEIEFVKGVQISRAERLLVDVNANGKIIIK